MLCGHMRMRSGYFSLECTKFKRNNMKQINVIYVRCFIIVIRDLARAMLSFIEFTHLTYCKEGLIYFLMQHGVLASTIKCHKCNNDVYIDKETLLYRCRRWYLIKNVHNKRAPCNVILREVLRLVLGSKSS